MARGRPLEPPLQSSDSRGAIVAGWELDASRSGNTPATELPATLCLAREQFGARYVDDNNAARHDRQMLLLRVLLIHPVERVLDMFDRAEERSPARVRWTDGATGLAPGPVV